MGWTSFRLNEPVKEWFNENWNSENRQVLDVAIVKRTTLYAAIKDLNTGEVHAIIYLIRFSRGYDNFMYKNMDETDHPFYYECPMRIINLLTHTDNANANQWRQKVYEHWNMQKKLNSGDFVLKTESPVRFSNGMSFEYFKKVNKKYYAGELQANGIFASFCHVRFNPTYYKHELIST